MNRLNHNLIIECLKELSDAAIQERLWTGRSQHEQSSFVEAVEGLFTDTGLGDALHAGKTGVSAEAELKLRELEKLLSKVRTQDGPMKVINDPAMPQVRALAADVLALIEKEMKWLVLYLLTFALSAAASVPSYDTRGNLSGGNGASYFHDAA